MEPGSYARHILAIGNDAREGKRLIRIEPLEFGQQVAIAVEVKLPKTTLLSVSTKTGYIMCGALDVGLLNTRLRDRGILAGRAVGVQTIEQLLEAPLESVTLAAEEAGIRKGMTGREAILRLLELERGSAA